MRLLMFASAAAALMVAPCVVERRLLAAKDEPDTYNVTAVLGRPLTPQEKEIWDFLDENGFD